MSNSANAVRADTNGNVYVAGRSRIPPPGGEWATTAVLRKYDSTGAEQWIRETDPDGFDGWFSVDVDSAGDVYVAGYTDGSLLMLPLDADALIRKYDSSGAEKWTKEFVAKGNQYAHHPRYL
jgi:hypothetical protein